MQQLQVHFVNPVLHITLLRTTTHNIYDMGYRKVFIWFLYKSRSKWPLNVIIYKMTKMLQHPRNPFSWSCRAGSLNLAIPAKRQPTTLLNNFTYGSPKYNIWQRRNKYFKTVILWSHASLCYIKYNSVLTKIIFKHLSNIFKTPWIEMWKYWKSS